MTDQTPMNRIVEGNPAERENEIARRIAVFRRQMADWREQARPGDPVLVMPGAPPFTPSACISCGTQIGPGRLRCEPCLEAVKAVLAEWPPARVRCDGCGEEVLKAAALQTPAGLRCPECRAAGRF